MIVLVLLVFKMAKKELPFCRSFQHALDGNTGGVAFLSLFLVAFMAGIHFALSLVPPFGMIANIAVSVLLSAI